MRQRGSGDPELVRADEPPLRRQLSPDFGMNTRDLLGDLDRPNAREQVLDKRSAANSPRAARPLHSVKELADGDHADRPFVVTDCPLDLRIDNPPL